METIYAKSFSDTIYDINERRRNLDAEIKELCCNVAKAFMEKYKTNQIQFDLEYNCPTFSVSRIDDENADCDVCKIIFDENGEILSVDGHTYYDDDELYDTPIDEFYDVDYLEIAECINYQLENEQYIE